MNRRTYFKTLGVALAAPQLRAQTPLPASNGKLKIAAVEVWRIDGHFPPSPINLRGGTPWPRDTPKWYIKIKTDAGVEGLYGPVWDYAATVVDQQLKPFLIGKDPLAGDALWDQMIRHGFAHQQGIYYMAVSAVDNALWDLRGRYYNTPVYRLLGGPTRGKVECYASFPGVSLEPYPEGMRKLALQFKKEGFKNEKWFLTQGSEGFEEDLKKNVAMVRTLRETLGDDMGLMIDTSRSMDLNYACEFAKRIEKYNPRWMEESFPPGEIQSFVELRKRTRVAIASGEHLYGRWAAADYLRAGAVDIMQTDTDWTGGVSEQMKICAMASQYGVQVMPHGDTLRALVHVYASQSPRVCPIMEYQVNMQNAGKWNHYFEKDPLIPSEGMITLPERPGFGIELDPARVERQTLLKATWS